MNILRHLNFRIRFVDLRKNETKQHICLITKIDVLFSVLNTYTIMFYLHCPQVLQCGTVHGPFPTIIFQFAPLIVSSRTPRHSRGLLFTAKKRFRTYAKPLFAVKLSIGILSALFNHQSAADRMVQVLVAGSSKFFFQHQDILL